MKKCTKCKFSQTCIHTNKMDASGSTSPIWLFVGEAPSSEEDKLGIQFVGKAGIFLKSTLKEIGFPLDECAYTNAVRCWPGPGNPTPKDIEIKACKPYLEEDIKRLKPKVIVMLGATALKAVANRVGISQIRGMPWNKNGTYYLPTYHPASIFYDESKLEPFVKDLTTALTLPIQGIQKTQSSRCHISQSIDESIDILETLKLVPEDITSDIEANTNAPWETHAKMLMMAFCIDTDKAYCLPFYKDDAPYTKGIDVLIDKLKEVITYRNKHNLGFEFYNMPFDIGFLKLVYGLPYPIVNFDPYCGHHLLREDMKKPALSQLTWTYNKSIAGYDDEIKNYIAEHPDCDLEKSGYDNIPFDILSRKNCYDVISTRMLRAVFEPEIKEQGSLDLYKEVVLPYGYVLADFFINGMAIDIPFMEDIASQYSIRMNKIITEVRELDDVKKYEKTTIKKLNGLWDLEEENRLKLGKKPRKKKKFICIFNPGSGDQIRSVLFDIAKLKPIKFTDGKKPSIDKEVREYMQQDHPLIPLVDEYAELQKFYGTYIKRIGEGVKTDGLYHPSYDITGTVAGRLSGDMQQLPRGTTNKDIKKMFISRFGDEGCILNSDVAGAELRMFAIVSGDKVLTEIFNKGQDPHLMIASLIYGMNYDECYTKYIAKDPKMVKIREDEIKPMVSFGLPYGREAEALAKDMKWPVYEAEKFRTKFFKILNGVKRKIIEIQDFVRINGYVINTTGRIRRLPIAQSKNEMYRAMKEKALRQAVNFVIQSSTHDLVMAAAVEIGYWFEELQLESKLVGEVHDSIIVDAKKNEVETIKNIIEGAFSGLSRKYSWITIPMAIDIKTGPNLLELEKIT